jgi:hypothetical protein
MSEAEKSVNVEDVLSSIRRLVADGPRIVPEHPKPASVAEPDPAQTEDLAVEPEEQEPTLEDIAQPASFVDTMNASIAEITDTTVEEPVSEVEARVAHVDAFLEAESEQPPELETHVEEATDKSEPFVLRAEMVADFETTEPSTDMPIDPENVQSATPDAQEDNDISFHDTLEDDEAFLDSVEDDETIELETPGMDPTLEAAMFNEDALREIVGELVRAELQGDLGDRITRNVRKLVRREIHHALATRDFE